MSKEELIALLRDPGQTGQAVGELYQLIERYPYFHTGYQLYLKGLQQTDEGKMALQLTKTAFCVRDRAVLYNYINHPSALGQQPLPIDNSIEITAPEDSGIPPETVTEESAMSDNQLMDVIRRQLEEITPPQTEEIQTETSRETSGNDLIDEFLKSNPKITPDEDSVFHVDLSDGMQEIPDIATDTLAEIYASQGHIDKAIEIFEHLILKYPEKHIYFAAQIDRLKVQK